MSTKSQIDKKALKRANNDVVDGFAFQTFLRMYHVTPDPTKPLEMSPAELIFARKARFVLDNLILSENMKKKT